MPAACHAAATIKWRRVPDQPEPPGAAVVRSVGDAARRLRHGDNVVLLVAPDRGHVVCPAGGPGRLAVLVGDPDDAAVLAVGALMASELFGSA
jgi:hypothetical protein